MLARLLRTATLPLAVLALACSGRGVEVQTAQGPDALSAPPAPASPTAARIVALPRTPTPLPPDHGAVEALLRRVTLYPTDVPRELQAEPPVVEDAAAAAARTPDPIAFLARAQVWGRTLSLRATFAAPSAAEPVVTAVTIHFTTPEGAQAQFQRFRTEGLPALLADAGLDGATVSVDRAQPAAAPPAGEEALRWRWPGADGTSVGAGEVVAVRRGAFIALVLLSGAGDAGALAQALDGRAAAVQPDGR